VLRAGRTAAGALAVDKVGDGGGAHEKSPCNCAVSPISVVNGHADAKIQQQTCLLLLRPDEISTFMSRLPMVVIEKSFDFKGPDL
ncbi:MAG: hypothetical protein ACI9M6_000438, partial [Hydrogenophaga sp.]